MPGVFPRAFPGVTAGLGTHGGTHGAGASGLGQQSLQGGRQGGRLARRKPFRLISGQDFPDRGQVAGNDGAAGAHVFKELDGGGELAVHVRAIRQDCDAGGGELGHDLIVGQAGHHFQAGRRGWGFLAQALMLGRVAANEAQGAAGQQGGGLHQVGHPFPAEETAGVDDVVLELAPGLFRQLLRQIDPIGNDDGRALVIRVDGSQPAGRGG